MAARQLLGRRHPVGPPAAHLAAAVDWLVRACEKSPDGGVSYGYSLRGGWRPAYRETSGYIAVTFFELARRLGEPAHRERALAVARWLVAVQNPDGSVSNPGYDAARGIVFDTGQVLFGLLRAFEESRDEAFLAAAERAGDWLVRVADERGRWTRHTFRGVPHVYNSRVAWALLRLHALRPQPERERVARENLEFALEQQRPSGFFAQNAFVPGVPPFTHTIAYATRGLLEAGLLTGETRYVDAAARAAEAALTHLRDDGFVPGRIDEQGRAQASYCCLTGNCQLAIVWAKLHVHQGQEKLRRAAASALRYVMACQDVATANRDVRGAIAGSHPVWGGYSPFTFPNWATKFFVDAMLLASEWMDR
jgi:uncharacterized protein YyaL (SSP411 family)